MARRPSVPRFYFSLRSPYSWLAWRELVERHPDVADRVEWRPFWEPDRRSGELLAALGGEFPYSAMSRAKHLYVLQDVARLAKRLDRTLVWPVDRDPVWEVPHLAYLVAERHGRGREYVAAAYRTRWEEGRNICDPAVIAGIGDELGLEPEELAGAAEQDELREQGARLLYEVCRDGVFGVPFFVHGFSRYWGLDRLADFVALLREQAPPGGLLTPAGALSVAEAAAPSPGSDQGHAGGCG
ncbi:hypothetical protein GCM10018790_68120 [Kitasatospora xanthocidica]|uniref:2-hydroxychromene-2-carboxylate isomerase n=1 Tax=Kitasatospora xanthocidica TaxID=83382 RepID=UPI00167B8816|nr:DsbA family protein [Kitasatospora xanthocidica]GHF80753.1 hypothetical protein GCM10018790_68120 [Kitasatospora xanthocidica]